MSEPNAICECDKNYQYDVNEHQKRTSFGYFHFSFDPNVAHKTIALFMLLIVVKNWKRKEKPHLLRPSVD